MTNEITVEPYINMQGVIGIQMLASKDTVFYISRDEKKLVLAGESISISLDDITTHEPEILKTIGKKKVAQWLMGNR